MLPPRPRCPSAWQPVPHDLALKMQAGSPTVTSRYDDIPAFADDDDNLNAVVETAHESRNKFKFDVDLDMFRLTAVLPSGLMFPYDFGFIPGTLGEDGDPLDILLLIEEPAFAGCLVVARPIGVIEAVQYPRKKPKKQVRNDRVIAVAVEGQQYRSVQSLAEIDGHLLKQLEQFFVDYNQELDKVFEPEGCRGPGTARKLVRAGMKKFQKQRAKPDRKEK
jgi:inorganic pyrophosphatase